MLIVRLLWELCNFAIAKLAFCGKFYGRKVENFVDFARGRCECGCFLA
jgi:hypothetical protein